MADEILRSKHGFGLLENIDQALLEGKVDAYDILFVKDRAGNPYVGWIDKDGQKVIIKGEEKVIVVDGEALPKVGEVGKIYIFNDEGYFWNGNKFVSFSKQVDISEFESRLGKLESDFRILDTTVAGLVSEVNNVKSDVSKAQDKIDEVQTEITEVKGKVNNLQTGFNKVQEDVANLGTKVSNLETELDNKVSSDEVEDKIEQSKLEAVNSANKYADEKAENVKAYADDVTNKTVDNAINNVLDEVEHLYKKVKYEISNTPVGTIVDYREKEIRVMCPKDTVFTKQSVGNSGNENMYYMAFKAYAPDGAVSFKEGDKGVIVDEMFTFDNDFAGTDKYGRNYSIVWLALANYDSASDIWNYFGKTSTTNKYIGWTYIVEWYNAEGKVISSDSIKINLSNEDCHYAIEPYYMANATVEVNDKIVNLETKNQELTTKVIELEKVVNSLENDTPTFVELE